MLELTQTMVLVEATFVETITGIRFDVINPRYRELREEICCDVLYVLNRQYLWLFCTTVAGLAFSLVLAFAVVWRKLTWYRKRRRLIS